MSDARLRWLAVLVAATLVVVVGVGSVAGSSAAATSLQASAQAALANAGLDGVAVQFAGREATLSGGSHADLAEAESLVAGLQGVRSARALDDTEPAPSSTQPVEEAAPNFRLQLTSDRVAISGVVPDADAAAEIKAAVALTFNAMVTGDLTVDADSDAAPWAAAVPGLLGDLAGVRNLDLVIKSVDALHVGGVVESAVGRVGAAAFITAALPGVTVTNDITIDPAGMSKADATLVNGSQVHFDQGASLVTYVAVPTLDALADFLQRHPKVVLEIASHPGPNDPAQGKRLGNARVAAVKAYLVAIGIDARQLSTRTHVPSNRTAVEPDAEQYRRVDFTVKRK